MISPSSPVILNIGSFPLRYYSVFMFGAILSGFLLSCLVAKKYYKNVSVDRIWDIFPIIVVCAVLGARFYYVALDWAYYSKHLSEIFAFQQGGLSIHGALLGGFCGGLYCVKKYKLSLWAYADVFSYGLLLGQAVGRFGNYFNIEAFGLPCAFSDLICLYVPQYKRPVEYFDVAFFHPTFLYEALWNIFALLILFFVVRKLAKNVSGIVFFAYLGIYSFGRLMIEHVRLDSVLNVGQWHAAEIVSIFIIFFSIVMIFWRRKAFAARQAQ